MPSLLLLGRRSRRRRPAVEVRSDPGVAIRPQLVVARRLRTRDAREHAISFLLDQAIQAEPAPTHAPTLVAFLHASLARVDAATLGRRDRIERGAPCER